MMDRKSYPVATLAVLLLLPGILTAVEGEKTSERFVKIIGQTGESVMFNGIARTADAIYVVGWKTVKSSPLHWAFWKFDLDGQKLVEKMSSENAQFNGLAVDGSTIYATGFVDTSPKYRVLLIAFDDQGNVLWERNWADESGMRLTGMSVAVSGDFVYVIGQGTWLDRSEDAVLLKYSKSGAFQWAKRFGGPYSDFAYDIVVYDGRIYAAGTTNSYPTYEGEYDGWVMVADQQGNSLANYVWGGSEDDEFYGIDAGSDIYLTGYTYPSGDRGQHLVVVRMDISGNVVWSKTFAGSTEDFGYKIRLDGKNLHIAGTTFVPGSSANMIYLRYSTEGEFLGGWTPGWTAGSFSYLTDLSSRAGSTYLLGYGLNRTSGHAMGILTAYESIYNLTVNLPRADCWVSLDGQTKTGTSVTFEVSPSEHTLAVMREVTDAGTRWSFSEWEDGTTAIQRTVILGKDTAFTAIYRKEYQVQVSSDQGTTSGSGWYESGASVVVSISPTTIQKDFFSNYVFEGWRSGGSIVSTSATYTFSATQPVSLTASWKTGFNVAIVGAIAGAVVVVAIVAIFLLRRPKTKEPPPMPDT